MQEVQWDFEPRKDKARTRIYILSDLHLGHAGAHKALLKRHIAKIAEDADCHVILGGDILDAICLQDRRARLSQMDPDIIGEHRDDLINQQVNMALDLLAPIARKIRLMLIGNHEEAILERASVDPLQILADGLGLSAAPKECLRGKPYEGAYCAYMRLRWPEAADMGSRGSPHWWMLDIAAHHGAGGGRKPGAKVNRVDDRAGWYPTAHIVASGHNHSRTMHERVGLAYGVHQLAVSEAKQLCFNTGAYLRTYYSGSSGSHYAERADYPPSALGGVYAEVEMMRTCQRPKKRLKRGLLLRGGFL
jgi:hypothetical protein